MVKCGVMNKRAKSTIYRAHIIHCADRDSLVPQFLEVRNGTIRSISRCRPGYPEAEVFDFGRLVIAPLFCDHHLHFFDRSGSGAADAGKQLIRHGIGRALEGGDRLGAGLTARTVLGSRPQILTAGYALYKKGGYGSALGKGAEDAEDAERKIDELLSLPVDYIKIIHSGIYEPESDLITAGGFTLQELRHIVDHARKKGLAVYCHANGDSAVKEAVHAGVTAVIHGLRVSGMTLAAMASGNVAFIPTLNAFQGLRTITRTDAGRLNLEKALSMHLSAVRRAYELGVRVLPGSDAGPSFLPYGSSYLAELLLLERAGLPYPDLIRAASASELQVNAPADFLLLDGLSVKRVVMAGKVVC